MLHGLPRALRENENLVFWFVFALVLTYTFTVRVFYSRSGLPYLHDFDEPFTASTALRMLKTGDLNPHYFDYGTLPMYLCYFVDILHYLYLMGRPVGAAPHLAGLDAIRINTDTGWFWAISHPSFYQWDRVLIAVLGTGTVLLTFLLSKDVLKNKWLGLLAAAFLGALPFHIQRSALVLPDGPVAFFVLGSVYFSLRFLDRGKTGDLIAGLAFCGLATATKYNSALAILLPAAVIGVRYVKDRDGFRGYWLALLPLVPLAVFFLVMPYAFLDRVAFLKGAGFEIRHYKVFGHPGHTSQPGLDHIRFQLGQFRNQLGRVASALALVGLLGVFRKPKLIAALLVPTCFFVFQTQMKVNFHRNFLQVYPFIALLFASSALLLLSAVARAGADLPDRARRIGSSIVVLVFTALVARMGYGSWNAAIQARDAVETRSQAVLDANAMGGTGTVYIAKELRIHELDLRKLARRYAVESMAEMPRCRSGEKGAVAILPVNPIILSSHTAVAGRGASMHLSFDEKNSVEDYKNSLKADQELLSVLSNAVVKRIGGHTPLNLDVLSDNPGIVIASMDSLPPCGHASGGTG